VAGTPNFGETPNPTPTLNTKINPNFGVTVPSCPAKFNLDKN